MNRDANTSPPDAAARDRALDITKSYIVQAPAGSGKTELLIQRMLSLLAVVEQPEEVLAITFTRKAAAEMSERLVQALRRAQDPNPPSEPHARKTWERAVAVLKRDEGQNWNLLSNPSRLQVMTIDSFCSSLSRRMPWLTRLGEQPGISDDPDKLYRQAVEQFLGTLETDGPGQESISRLLHHLDNRLPLLRDLLVNMLSRRDQWLRHVVAGDASWRSPLEESLRTYIASILKDVRSRIDDELFAEILETGRYAAQQLALQGDDVLTPLLREEFDPRNPDHLECWQALCHLVLTRNGTVRKSVNKNLGFGPGKSGEAPRQKQRMNTVLERLESESLGEELAKLRVLPAARYSDEQWEVLQALLEILPLAVVELRSIFRQTGTVDFIEVAGAALAGLGSTDAPGDLLLKLDRAISHILVDEFQDTSHLQYELLCRLTAGWEPHDGRTLFVVGDPMQSIYLFREADVGLFLRVRRDGLGGIRLESLSLSANFRSQEKLVNWFNVLFQPLFPAMENELTGAVTYASAVPVRASSEKPAVTMQLFRERQDEVEATAVVDLVRQAEKEVPGGSCVVLVRSRGHLERIAVGLKNHGIRFQAQEIDPLTSRPVVFDLLALTRALLQPCDRVAWLAVLRAPWCGLCLSDLLQLAPYDKNESIYKKLTNLPKQQEMFDALSQDGRDRLNRVEPVLQHALDRRGKIGLRRLVESTWQSLGGPACVDEQGLDDSEQFFELLHDLDTGGDLVSVRELVERLEKLYAAPDPQAIDGLQLMTIHKAKGLEFDTVILPGLGRGIRPRERQLLQWLEQPDLELLLAPIPPAGGEDDVTYRAIGSILKQKEEYETLRLFYVAATRARERLHLLGHVSGSEKDPSPLTGSLLHAAWPIIATPETDIVEPSGAVETGHPAPSIRRLPARWEQPELPSFPMGRQAAFARASDVAGDEKEGTGHFTLQSEEGRFIGTVVHQLFERMAINGVEHWQRKSRDELEWWIRMRFGQLGIPQGRHDECLDKVLKCLENACTSRIAQWILGEREEGACELGLRGIVDGTLTHASIDRTFIEEDVRWVIDYKTSSPADGQDLEEFLAAESERYRDQIAAYVTLFSAYDEKRKVRGALYFPMIDGWRELVI